MNRRAYRTSILADAVEVVEERHPGGARKSASYFVAGEKVGHREWEEDGKLDFEYVMRNGVKHGREYRFHGNGQPLDEDRYRHGKLHGIGRQWAEDGTLLVSWRMVNGTGLDLWCNDDGTLAEEHSWPKDGELGCKRQWNGDARTVREEEVWGPGHGSISRQGTAGGRLRRGFPCFFIHRQKVTRRQYLKACQADPTLPPYRPEDDDPHRELPAEYLAQREKGGDDGL